MGENEKFYDEQIAPKLLELMHLCKEKSISFCAQVEWETGETGRTEVLLPEASINQKLVHWSARAQGNIDALMIAVMRHAKEHGHSSAVLSILERKRDL